MLKRLILLLIPGFVLSGNSIAQDKGILPFTGARFFKEGLSVKSMEIRTDGAYLLSNRFPLNKEMEVRFLMPAGFAEDKARTVFAAAELGILSLKGAMLSLVPNLLKDSEIKGIPQGKSREIVLKVTLKPEVLKAEPGCTIRIRLYDLKSKNQLKLEIPVVIARPGEAIPVSKIINELKTADPSLSYSAMIKIKSIQFSVDTGIRVNPKMAYMSMDMNSITGSAISEMLSGKESFWVYDSELNEVKITDKQLKQVGGAMENNEVNYLSKIPFRLKTTTGKAYFVRFRWESTDKRKVIDIVVPR